MKSNFIAFAFDFLDPWCWIGEKRLRQAMVKTGVILPIDYQACRSAYPKAQVGLDYQTFQENRFGSHAKNHEEALFHAAAECGISLDLSLITTMPNTESALRLMQWQKHRGKCLETLFEGIYQARFCKGEEISDPESLLPLLEQDPEERQLTLNFLRSEDGISELLKAERETIKWCGRLSPAMKLGETLISGAQPTEILAMFLKQSRSKAS
jgi:predicted DsbA family dithiol-disulfide isomerase